MLKLFSKLFGGNKSEKDVKDTQPLVVEINEFFEQYATLSNDELRAKTTDFKARIAGHLKDIDAEIASLKEEAASIADFHEQEEVYDRVDKLVKDRDKQLEEILTQLLPEAFAVFKETARRFSTNAELKATAAELDIQLAKNADYVRIEGDQAIYKNTWKVRGIPLTWNMVHYDSQLIGGIVLHQGKIAEMATGEGKTLVSTLPVYLNALAGEGVHLVTVNDYLSRRDAEWNRPLFNFLGLTIDCIDYHEPNTSERREAYKSDITYGTNNEFGFDYLRDNMVRDPEEMVQRKHHFAIVDEVDSVLIDDARTPLIISGPTGKNDDEQEFHTLKPRITKLVEAQKKVSNFYLNEAKKLIAEGKDGPEQGGQALLRAHRALPKFSPLIKFLSESGHRSILQKAENRYLSDNAKDMPKVDEPLYFVIDEKNNQVDLTDRGIELITGAGEDPHFFIIPDLGAGLVEIDKQDLTAEEKIAQKDKLYSDFAIKSDRLHSLQQLLKAYALFEKDIEYVVMDGKVKIVDENTGRILEGRRYSDGLHQAIEAKENVKVEAATQTYATVTLQNYFRMYHKLAGMTGTAETEAGEFWDIYKLDVVVIPTNKPIIRKDNDDLIYKTKREKYNALIMEIEKLNKEGRPVLVGTTNVEVSELLSRMLRQRGIKHNVLNAKQHQREAEVVAEAGFLNAVTIATNMAGRGTDIKLGPGVVEVGGLAIIGSERHDARRVDRQLRGRAGRQGDPGSSQFFMSLEDDLMRLFGSERVSGIMDRLKFPEGESLNHPLMSRQIQNAQKKVEENNFGIRKRLLEYDNVMNAQREVVYKKRRHALFGDRLQVDLDNMIYELGNDLIGTHQETADFDAFKLDCIRYMGFEPEWTAEDFRSKKEEELTDELYVMAHEHYMRKKESIRATTLPILNSIHRDNPNAENVVIPFTDGKHEIPVYVAIKKALENQGNEVVTNYEKGIVLGMIDDAWKEHLREMDDLKTEVQNAVYEQKDPILIYKLEAFKVFNRNMVGTVNRDVLSFLFKGLLPNQQAQAPVRRAPAQAPKSTMPKLRTIKEDADSVSPTHQNSSSSGGTRAPRYESNNTSQAPLSDAPKQMPVIADPKIGRNDPCYCGSGKKFKNCHGKEA